MMNRALCLLLLSLLTSSGAEAHSVEYRVENKGISARVFFGGNESASYSPFEVFGPGDTIPHQKGRTDKNGFVTFLPDRAGTWSIKVVAESEHGGHAANIVINVNEGLYSDSFKKPLVAEYAKISVGFGVVLGMFGLWALWNARRERLQRAGSDGSRTNP
ncbi:MAG: hypothetical protein V2B18_19445 [Pseudomonadota bacterium]